MNDEEFRDLVRRGEREGRALPRRARGPVTSRPEVIIRRRVTRDPVEVSGEDTLVEHDAMRVRA